MPGGAASSLSKAAAVARFTATVESRLLCNVLNLTNVT